MQKVVVSEEDGTLHYKEYFATLPWRGYTKFVVDSIVSIEEMSIKPSMEEELTSTYWNLCES